MASYDVYYNAEIVGENDQSSMACLETASFETDLNRSLVENSATYLLPTKRPKRENLAFNECYEFSCIEELVHFGFNKKYSFPVLSKPHLCPLEKSTKQYLYKTEKWNAELSEFRTLKEKLNCVKGRLNDYDLNEWHEHTRSTNPAGLVIRTLKNKIKQEFLTQAWCKFYELISEFNLIPADALNSHSLCSVHLCEAPGAFIASLHHYLKSNYPSIKWHWFANSLNPYYEGNSPAQMINDDRFMRETIENWDFGPDMTGDISHLDYTDHLKRKCRDHLPHLVTADGSFDCQDAPGEQESSVSWLHLKETLTALNILRTGGHFVIKMFTFFECDTICLLYLLRVAFEHVDVIKPVTSKEGNSEVYVVCRKFKGNNVELGLQDLSLAGLEQHRNFAMLPYELIHRDFIKNILDCAEQFVSYQKRIIERNIRLFDDRHNVKLQRLFKFIHKTFAEKFIETFKVQPIALAESIVPLKNRAFKARRSTSVTETCCPQENSHTDRINKLKLTREEVFNRISDELVSLGIHFWAKKTFMPEIDVKIEDVNVLCCKPIQRVMSSQFCPAAYIRMMNELMDTISVAIYNDFFAKDPSNFVYDCKVCDLRSIYVQSVSYSEAQSLAYQKILSILSRMEDGDDLVLINFSLLTQFNVNLLCVLKQIFKQIEFRDANTLYLADANVEQCDKWKMKLEEIRRLYSQDQAVLSFLPLNYITGVKNALYEWLMDINSVCAYHEILKLTDSKLKNTPNELRPVPTG